MLLSTMRHFGPKDPTPLSFIRQSGAVGVVSALHHVPVGDVWTEREIMVRKQEIEAAGLVWSVVESLPVSEAIKTRSGNYQQHLDNYLVSLRNLARCGLTNITYNFMPVMDWTRTDLNYVLPDGSSAIRFDQVDVAMFDIHVLKRKNASKDYTPETVAAAAERFATASEVDRARVKRNIIKGLPGSEESFTLEQFREALATYDGIDRARLQQHLVDFLAYVTPTAAELGMVLTIHPDDPPFPLLGLPRVLSTAADFQHLIDQVPSPANGLCFCTGSFGVRADNDLPAMVRQFAERIHFIHLRSTQSESGGSFHEANHLEGDVPMREVMKALLEENARRAKPIPMRPDHGHRMLDDTLKPDGQTAPGYTAIGRMRGLAELVGLQLGLG